MPPTRLQRTPRAVKFISSGYAPATQSANLEAIQCDQCRRRKAKCNGETGCEACEIHGLRCSYGDPAKQLRGPAYVALLENKIKQLEGRLEELRSGEGHEQSALSMPGLNHAKQDVDLKAMPCVSVTPVDDDNIPYDNLYPSGLEVEAVPQPAPHARILSSDIDNIALSPVRSEGSASRASTTSSIPTLWSNEKSPAAEKWPRDTDISSGLVYNPSPSFWGASLSQPAQQVLAPTSLLASHQRCETAMDATKGLDPSLAWNDCMLLDEQAAMDSQYIEVDTTMTLESNNSMALDAKERTASLITYDTTASETEIAMSLGEYDATFWDLLPYMSPHIGSPAPTRRSLGDIGSMFLPQLGKDDRQLIQSAVKASSESGRSAEKRQKLSAEQRTIDHRERNRIAAAKFRAKKVGTIAQLTEDAKSLGIRNAALRRELHALEAKRSELRSLLDMELVAAPRSARQMVRDVTGTGCAR